LDDLIEIYVVGPSLDNFCADHEFDLWLEDRPTSRRPHQSERKAYKVREKRCSASNSKQKSDEQDDEEDNDTCSDDDKPKFILDKWDQWFLSSDDSDDVSDV